MGVANQRSIAWSCVETFAQNGWKVILTSQNDKLLSKAQALVDKFPHTVKSFPCDVATDMQGESSSEFSQRLADALQGEALTSVVHSLAHAPNLKTTPLLQVTQEDFSKAHEISSFSLIEVARQTRPFLQYASEKGSITALSYLGAVRAIPGYNVMGPAKASLESIVRGLALELSADSLRVNAVSSGPLATLSAKGGIAHFDRMQREVQEKAPLGNVTASQVASTIHFLSTGAASGITGQTIYVDGGYSIVGGPARLMDG
eukprot:Nitzschia sp. Nitz4//scaffold52_size167869//82450//83229//NITZ4_002279-RA/size167869-processed-gene-0.97-mRNA-1//1//CDS//3329554044//5975//frame0